MQNKWNWAALQRDGIVTPLFYYPKESPESLENWQMSIITLVNKLAIPASELSIVNLDTGDLPDQEVFNELLKQPLSKEKTQQIYDSIALLGKSVDEYL